MASLRKICSLGKRALSSWTSKATIKETLQRSDAAQEPLVEIHGWVKTSRPQKHVGFLMLNDGSTQESLQAVVTPAVAQQCRTGASVAVRGRLKKMGNGKGYEVIADGPDGTVTLLGDVSADV